MFAGARIANSLDMYDCRKGCFAALGVEAWFSLCYGF